jgi:hypothetical protein
MQKFFMFVILLAKADKDGVSMPLDYAKKVGSMIHAKFPMRTNNRIRPMEFLYFNIMHK